MISSNRVFWWCLCFFRDKSFINFNMSNAHFNGNESIHQTHCRFSDVSRENDVILWVFQLCYVQTQIVFRNSRRLKQVLIGDDMYLKDFDDQTILDTETLSLTYLHDQVLWFEMTAETTTPNQNALIRKKLENLFRKKK